MVVSTHIITQDTPWIFRIFFVLGLLPPSSLAKTRERLGENARATWLKSIASSKFLAKTRERLG